MVSRHWARLWLQAIAVLILLRGSAPAFAQSDDLATLNAAAISAAWKDECGSVATTLRLSIFGRGVPSHLTQEGTPHEYN